MRFVRIVGVVIAIGIGVGAARGQDAEIAFAQRIRPTLEAHCLACHDPADPKQRHDFLRFDDVRDVETRRRLWRDVATQLRNRTMPPGDAKISEQDRLFTANWIDERLRQTGCTIGEYAGYVAPRRLNRREYRNTIRDLFGLDLDIAALFPEDETGGAGFDTNGQTLYTPPMMLERYLDAAQAIVDQVVLAPPLTLGFRPHQMRPTLPAPPSGEDLPRLLAPGEEVSTETPVFMDGTYAVRVVSRYLPDRAFTVDLKVDGVVASSLEFRLNPSTAVTNRTATVQLSRGVHTLSVVNGAEASQLYGLQVTQQPAAPSSNQAALHYRLLGTEPGQAPLDPRRAARRVLTTLLPRAYRRPLAPQESDDILALYDRAAERGDPHEEALKYALKAVLASPKFLFRVEGMPQQDGLQPLGQYEMASRLSYFLWSTMPDDELFALAAENRLQEAEVLSAQVARMLDDPRSRAFAGSFIGQWLGAKDVGGRVMPLLTELQHYYTPEAAEDLRQQPELFLHYILSEDRSVLDLIDAPYTFLTQRLVRYYELDGRVEGVGPTGFHLVNWPDKRRAGVLGLASVLGMTSHYRQSSPVLRGAWVLNTLLGTAVPPPPPNVPPLPDAKSEPDVTMRRMLAAHREAKACSACHNLMDPIGLGLENFDWMGRWRDSEANGEAVDASGSLPSGETFDGPVELRQVLLGRKDEFIRHLVGKMLGYALGRGLQDGDQCTIEGIASKLAADGYRARTLVREVVLSAPFRKQQTDVEITELETPKAQRPRRLLGTK